MKIITLLIGICLLVGTVYAAEPGVIGFQWQSTNSSPIGNYTDSTGTLIAQPDNFSAIYPWSDIRRCVVSQPGNTITYGSNPRGDGLDLTGASGMVMVEIPKFYYNMSNSGVTTTIYLSANASPLYTLHPAFYQRGDGVTPNLTRNYIYVGSYEGVLFVNHTTGSLSASSFAGQQPWTGQSSNNADGMFVVGFANAPGFVPVIGSTISGYASGLSGTLVDYSNVSGSNGLLYLKQVNNVTGNVSSLFVSGETLYQSGTSFGTVDPNIGGSGASNLPMKLTYANAIDNASANGAQYGVENFQSNSAIKILSTIEYGNLNSQLWLGGLGAGISSKATGTGFAGNVTGSDSIDLNMSVFGTGTGSGTAAQVAIAYRGIVNPWGNVRRFISGFVVNSTAYYVINRNGVSSPDDVSSFAPANYENSASAPVSLTSGYITSISTDPIISHGFIPLTQGGSSTTYFSDFGRSYTTSTRRMTVGGAWSEGVNDGMYWVSLQTLDPTGSSNSMGFRIEYIPAPTIPGFTANVTSGFASLPVQFTDTSTGSPTNWSWDFNNDGTIDSTSQNPVYTYTVAGTYTVNLTVNNTANPDRSEVKTSYITVVPAGYPRTDFYCNASPVIVGGIVAYYDANENDPILFNQISDSTLAFSAFNWSWGDGSYNITSAAGANITHTYNTSGIMTVALSGTTAGGTNTTTKVGFVHVAASGFTRGDVIVDGAYTVTIHITDTSGAPLATTCVLTDNFGNTYSSANSTFILSTPYTTVSVIVSAPSYQPATASYVVDMDLDETIQMSAAVPVANPNIWYTMQLVRLTVVDAYGVPLPGSHINVTYINSTLPNTDISWLTAAFGISETVAGQMVNSSLAMQGDTTNDGSLSFMMFPALTYRLTISNASIGLANVRDIAPKDQDYKIYCPLSSQHAVNNTLNSSLTTSLPYYQLNTSGGYNLSMIYRDPNGYTTNLRFIVKNYNTGVTVLDRNWGNPGTAQIVDNYTVLLTRGQEYVWMFNATKVT